jgi:hypothetical protein
MGKTVKGVNICNILFDDKYAGFIQKMRETFKEDLEFSKTCKDFKVLGKIQNEYRDYVADNQSKLTLIESKKIINQEYFAILVSLIFDKFDSIDKFEDIFENYRKDFMVTHFGDYDFAENPTEAPSESPVSKCCCGHIVHTMNTYLLTNVSTGHSLLIGCDCIEKHKILSFEELKELKDKRRFRERTKEGRCYFCGKKGKCKACKNVKLARDVFKEWRRVSLIWRISTKVFTSKMVSFQNKRLKRMLKALIVKQKILKSRLVSFQTKRLQRLLKPLVTRWRLLYKKKCSKCRKILSDAKYDKCYTCYTSDKSKCDDCGKAIPNSFDKCYDCKYKYKCKLCNSKMKANKYENCYDCNMKKKRKYDDCDHCQGTKQMYYSDDCWGECLFC